MHAIHRTIVLLAALVFMIAAAAQAQQDKPAAPPAAPGAAQASTSASGELTDVDAKAATITVKTATEDMKFRYDDQTKVTGAQKGVAGLATMKGSQVTINYKKEGSNNIATSIDVRAGAGPADKK
jgi:3-oxoacyl-ACP reductase-like protein